MFSVEWEASPDGTKHSAATLKHNIEDAKVLKRKGDMSKVELQDDQGNVYRMWMSRDVVAGLADILESP